MKIEQTNWTETGGWSPALRVEPGTAHLVLVFGANAPLKNRELVGALRRAYPTAEIVGCSTGGEICGVEVADETLTVTAVTFSESQVKSVRVDLAKAGNSHEMGIQLADALPKEIPSRRAGASDPLQHVFLLSDGLKINGSELVAGMTGKLPKHVTVTGGLAGDGPRFGETLTLKDEAVTEHSVIALGFYGSHLRVGFGSLGGWDAFGPDRVVTRSEGNVLYELDGRSALELYKKYLGEHAAGLPATALLFPLSVYRVPGETPVVRTILNIDEVTQSMTFAGDVPQGCRAQLMKANFDRVIDGATQAAATSHQGIVGPAELAILVSCVGRKWILKQRVEEELEGVRSVLGDQATLTGFYSYGEISPFARGTRCELHNQTMTITTFAEV